MENPTLETKPVVKPEPLPPHMKSAEADDKICEPETLREFYEKNYTRLEKCHDDKKWICKDDEWKCPNDEYDCSWTGKYAPKRIVTMQHCPFGRQCGKFGLGGVKNRETKQQLKNHQEVLVLLTRMLLLLWKMRDKEGYLETKQQLKNHQELLVLLTLMLLLL